MTTIKISIVNGEKKSELELSKVDQLDKLLIMQSVFNLFEIDIDTLQFSKEYKKINNAYSNFFESMEQEEPKKEIKVDEVAKQLEEGLSSSEPTQETTWWHSGTKERDGQTVYICHYWCPVCNNKGNHYLPLSTVETYCHSCRSKMKVHSAHPDGVSRDHFGNFMRAGEFKDRRLWD